MTMQTPFDSAVREHGPTVLRVCRAVLGPGADADEAWSETFLSALRAWPDLDADTNVEAWLVRVARRRCVDVIRARQRRPEPLDEFPRDARRGPGAARESASPDAAAEAREAWDRVAALPEKQRLAIAYHYLGGLPHGEAAEILGGTAESVRRAAADGMRTLRAAYREDSGGGRVGTRAVGLDKAKTRRRRAES